MNDDHIIIVVSYYDQWYHEYIWRFDNYELKSEIRLLKIQLYVPTVYYKYYTVLSFQL